MTTYNEIYTVQDNTHALFTNLKPHERVFVYMIVQASIPFNFIARGQNHEYNNEIIKRS